MDEAWNVGDTNVKEEASLRLNLDNLGSVESSSDGKNGVIVFLEGRRE